MNKDKAGGVVRKFAKETHSVKTIIDHFSVVQLVT